MDTSTVVKITGPVSYQVIIRQCKKDILMVKVVVVIEEAEVVEVVVEVMVEDVIDLVVEGEQR